MAHQRKALRIISGLLGVVALIGLAAVLYHFRPLIPSRTYKATVETPAGGQAKATVYSMLGRASWIFVRVPESHRDPERPANRWFLWDTQDDAVSMSWAKDSPYLHRNHDQSRGINLLDGKMEDNWRIKRDGRSVWFSNDRQTITVEPGKP